MKRGMTVFGETSVSQVWGQLARIFSIPEIIIGFACFGISAVLWLVVVSRMEVSYAYPLVSISYIIVLVVSYFWFGEQVTVGRVVGVLLICSGVVVITWK